MTTPSRHRTGSLIIDAFRLCKHELHFQNSSSLTCPSIKETDLHIAAKDSSEEYFHHIHQNRGTFSEATKGLNLLKNKIRSVGLRYTMRAATMHKIVNL